MSAANNAPPNQDISETNGSLLRRIGNVFRVVLGLKPRLSLRSDLEDALLRPPSEDPGFSLQERSMLGNILKLRERRAVDIMVPRADIIAVDQHLGAGELLNVFREAGHSRLPVYHETLDDLVGMVHIRDFLSYLTTSAPRKPDAGPQQSAGVTEFGAIDLSVPLSSANIIRPVLFAPPSMPAIDLLVKMQATRIHLALVIDEYGGTFGLVSIEDIIEEVVGDIEDEHDENEKTIVALDDAWVASARASLDEIRNVVGEDFHADAFSEEMSGHAEGVDTIGGFVTAIAGRVPVRGELIKGPNGFEFEVLDADPRRVKKLRIKKLAEPARAGRAPREASAASR